MIETKWLTGERLDKYDLLIVLDVLIFSSMKTEKHAHQIVQVKALCSCTCSFARSLIRSFALLYIRANKVSYIMKRMYKDLVISRTLYHTSIL